ncbi:MAG: ZIP family metal transporter [Campylobacterota bacterium]|nr:ZIP family metal transporter [Campylobacterota bacterium]
MTILLFKTIMVLLIIITALAGGYLAFKIKESSRSTLYFSLGNTFAAGIFLGAGLIHMLPDAREGFSTVLASDFPFAAFIASLGFLLILFIEKSMAGKQKNASYILIFILSIHSIIVGVALGTEETIKQSIIIAIAVLAHKGSAAFALGVSMLKSEIESAKIMNLITMFSLMTPLGIVIGLVISNALSGKSTQFSIALFDALAAGTFLYIAIMDIFNEEFEEKSYTYLKLLFAVLGLLLMALLAVWL